MEIGVDLLGGETASQNILEGVRLAKASSPDAAAFHLYNTEPVSDFPTEVVASEVSMDDLPTTALRYKKDSSLYQGILDLQAGKIQAFVSTGNTGAMVSLAKILLPCHPGVERLALLAALPTSQGYTHIVDAGGHPRFHPGHLFTYTELAVEHLRKRKGIVCPKVALLNIGTESSKGTKDHQALYKRLLEHQNNFTFMGNIEGKDVFSGLYDLVVTDGFTGNIFLKTAEGASEFLVKELQGLLSQEDNSRLAPHYQTFKERFSQTSYPGAIVLGPKRLLVKCHGRTCSATIKNALLETMHYLKMQDV